MNQLSEAEKITIASLKTLTSVHCWWENLSIKMEKDKDPIETWEKFLEYVRKEFYLPKYIEQQYKKWQQLRKWKDQSVQSYTDEFYGLMARIGIQEEEKLLVLKCANKLSLYIQQDMESLTTNTLPYAFHYASKLGSKKKGKACFMTKSTGQTSDKKSPVDSDKSRHPS